MPQGEVGAVCDTGHIFDRRESREDLSEAAHCDFCGAELNRSCSNWWDAIPVRRTRRRDGSFTSWDPVNACRSCGTAFPWSPYR
jgi:hypothetical protein